MSNSQVDDKSVHYYRLKVNINGFKIEDIKVTLEDIPRSNGKENPKARIKISAQRKAETETHEKGHENTSISKEYTKYHDLSGSAIKQYNINLGSMKYYLESKNPSFLVVEFTANSNENYYVTLDDSCESLVELAARSLLNVKSLENLREVIQDPFNKKLNHDLVDMFSPNLIRDLSLATTTTFTPIKVDSDHLGNKRMQMDIPLPKTLRTGTLALKDGGNRKNINYVDATHDGDNLNRVNLKIEGLKLFLEAVSSSDDTTSTYSKQFKLPKGTDTDRISYQIDQAKHSLVVEAPIRGV